MKAKNLRIGGGWTTRRKSSRVPAPRRTPRCSGFSCELTEPVDQPTLQLALERALEVFPGYRCSLRRGMFWYYLEDSTEQPIVREEYRPHAARSMKRAAVACSLK